MPVIADYACDDLRTNGGGRDKGDGHDAMRGRDIYFRRRGGPRPISRKWHFRGPTFPESNNTESSFNKGSATIYRGHASHSHLSASTAYIAIPPPVISSILLQSPPATPFIPGRSCIGILLPPPLVTTLLFFSLYRSSIREYFFPGFLPLPALFLSLPLTPSLARVCNRIRLRARWH